MRAGPVDKSPHSNSPDSTLLNARRLGGSAVRWLHQCCVAWNCGPMGQKGSKAAAAKEDGGSSASSSGSSSQAGSAGLPFKSLDEGLNDDESRAQLKAWVKKTNDSALHHSLLAYEVRVLSRRDCVSQLRGLFLDFHARCRPSPSAEPSTSPGNVAVTQRT